MQDADGDGDIDLLWDNPLHFAVSLVCLNNGEGQFECLAPPTPQVDMGATHETSLKQFRQRCFDGLLSAERSPVHNHKLSSQWYVYFVKFFKHQQNETLLRIASPISHLPAKRSLPFLSC